MISEPPTKLERSLLLYLECRATDHCGRINMQHMNADDIALAKKWSEEGFIQFGRVCFADAKRHENSWCTLSEEAWDLAHSLRKTRGKSDWEKRTWLTTEEV